MEIVIQTNQDLNGPRSPSELHLHQPDQPVSTRGLFRFASQLDVLLMVIGSITSAAMGAAIPIFAYLTGNMIDSFNTSNDIYAEAKKNLLYYIYLGIGALVVATVMFTSWMMAGERQAVRCRRQYFESLLRQEVAWFDVQKQAGISSTFQLDSMAFQMAVGEKISTLIMVIGMLAAGLGISFYLGWILTLIILGYLPIIIISWTVNIAVKSQTAQQEDQIYQESDAKLQESLAAITLVKQMNAEHFQASIQTSILAKVKQAYTNTITRYVCASSIAVLTLYLGFALAFWYGSECVFNSEKCPQRLSSREYTAGSVVKIFYSLFLPALSLNQLAPCLQKIIEGRAAASRIFSIIDRQPLIKSREDAIKPQQFEGIIEFKDVSFAYPKDKSSKILHGLNLKIDCKHSGIIGNSGSGKSTIFQLIMRFYDPDEGAIYLDGVDLRDLDLDWLRNQIGYVTQQPVLFASSIRKNLLLGKEDASNQQIQEALKKAEAFEFVMAFDNKLETYVGTGGSQLSGGQKQRIAIARALLKEPKLLLLDEATSALDNRNEDQILKTFNKFYNQFNTISITHRKRVLKNCDKIFQFKNGKISRVTYNKQKKPVYGNLLTVANSGLKKEQQVGSESAIPIAILTSVQSIETRIQNSESLIKPNQQLSKTNEQLIKPPQEQIQSESSLSRIFPYILHKKCLLILGIFLPIADGLMFPAVGLMLSKIVAAELQYILDPEYYQGQVHTYIYIVVGIAIVASCTNSFSLLIYSLLGETAVKRIRLEAIVKLLNMPVGWFQKEENQSQKVTSAVTRSCKIIYNFIKLFTPHLIFVIVNIFASMVAALIFEWRTGLTSFALIPLIILSQAIQLGFIQGFAESKSKVYGESSQKINESVMNIRTIFSLNSQSALSHAYNKQIEQIFEALFKKCMLSGFMYGVSYFLQFISFALMFFLAAVYVTNYSISIDDSLAAIFLIVFAGIAAGNNSNFMPDISEAKIATKQVFSIIDQQDEHQLRTSLGSQQLIIPITGNIEFKNVTFKYDNRDSPVLDNFSMTIKSGQTIGIVGASGCGKSTIFGLLLGFYTPKSGKILIEGVDIGQFELHHLRASFGVVSQEPILFNESIAWNIRYNLLDKSLQDIAEAAKEANFNPQYQKLQNEQDQMIYNAQSYEDEAKPFSILEKNVGPKGSHVSGGQKQRIAIARAMLRKPTVLLLDEATSALDRENECKVQDSLERMMRGKTTMSITHRLQTVERADLILVMNKGRVEQCGCYDDLMARQKLFFSLARGTISGDN